MMNFNRVAYPVPDRYHRRDNFCILPDCGFRAACDAILCGLLFELKIVDNLHLAYIIQYDWSKVDREYEAVVRLLEIKRFAGCMMYAVVVISEGGSENVRG